VVLLAVIRLPKLQKRSDIGITSTEKRRSVTTWRRQIFPFTDSIAAHVNGRKVSEHGEALRYLHKEQREATFATTWREIKQKEKRNGEIRMPVRGIEHGSLGWLEQKKYWN
jgi:hypothetical protein